ncbi:MAG: carboxypeptidase-like regulatory domain-containing protein [Gemmatimonas sp.]
MVRMPDAIIDAGERARATLRSGAIVLITALSIASATAQRTHAQEIRGTVVRSDSLPASGVVVLLMHATADSVLTRVVTGERGLFTVRAPSAGVVRLRLLRLGFQPTLDGPHDLKTGEIKNVRITLGEKRVVLATMDVKSDSKCNVRPDSAQLVSKLFEEARKALIASATPTSSARHVAAFTLYSRQQDERGKLIAPIQRNAFTGPSYRPFASLPADSLAKFVVEEKDETYYRAPDADVLLSDSFLGAHCLQFVQSTGERAASVGIGFRPSDRKMKMVDIKGTLWLDRETNELQVLEYQYDGVPETYQKTNVGGRVEYTQLAAGLWFVNKWAIRMPLNIVTTNPTYDGMRGAAGTNIEVAGLVVTGGEVASVKADDDFLYTNPSAVTAGREPRDIRDYASTGGEFTIAKEATVMAPKEVLTVGAADSVFTTSRCVDQTVEGYTGRVRGKVRALNGQKTAAIPVVAEWKDDFKVSGSREVTWQHRRLETKTNEDGSYAVCGLPINRVVSVAAMTDGRKSRVGSVKATQGFTNAIMDLTVGDLVGSVASMNDANGRGSLVVVSDLDGNPLSFATVSVVGGNAKVTDDIGRVILNVPMRDSLSVLTRRMGYTPYQGKIGKHSTGQAYTVRMARTSRTVETMFIRANESRRGLELTGFYDRMRQSQRGAGSGYFFTPEDVEATASTSVYQMLQTRTPVTVGTNYNAHVLTGRSYGDGRCPMVIVLDGIVQRGLIDSASEEYANAEAGLNKGQRERGMLDLKEIVNLSQVSAIEVYMSPTSVPASLSSKISLSSCGVVAIWTGTR